MYLGGVPLHGDRRAGPRRQPLGGRVRARPQRATGTRRRRAIVFGLAAVRNVGESLVERIVAERDANGPFADIFDFCQRVDPVVLNKRTMESLVKAGAFDSLGHPRQGLCLVLEGIVDRTLERRREQRPRDHHSLRRLRGGAGRPGLGRGQGGRSPTPSSTRRQRLAFEKEMLGLYVSDHPLMGFEAALARHTDCTLSDMREDGRASGRPLARADGRRRGDRSSSLLHEEGRPHGPLRARGPAGRHGGLRLPQDHGRVRRAHRERRHRRRARAGSTPVRRSRRSSAWRSAVPVLERGQEDLHITLPLGVLTDAKVDGLKERPERPSRARRRSCSTSGPRSSASHPSSTWTAATGWWASSNGCSVRAPCCPESATSTRRRLNAVELAEIGRQVEPGPVGNASSGASRLTPCRS